MACFSQMTRFSQSLIGLLTAATLTASLGATAQAAPKKDFDIAWTIYVGWMPWPYAAEAGIVKKWGDKYGINIKVTQINDYVELINQYTAGKFDGVTVTNMDSLTVPAAGGVDTSAIVLGDFSNGNDGIVLKNGKGLADIKGRKINIVELSVSHYLLARALATVKLRETRHQDRQHLGRRHCRRFQIGGFNCGGDLESAADGGEGGAEHDRGVQLEQDPRRDPGPAGDQDRDAQGQSRSRQGAGRHLVRDHRADGRPRRQGQGRAHRDGEALRHRPPWLRRPAQDHARCSTRPRTRSRS